MSAGSRSTRAAPIPAFAATLAFAALFACRSDTSEVAFVPSPAVANEPAAAVDRALAVGTTAPAFTSVDQDGRERSLDSLCGRDGVVLLFFRSADW
jgi:cytochrome oxidase Cu insertion factor (SCO1/SenC/PrrC family)